MRLAASYNATSHHQYVTRPPTFCSCFRPCVSASRHIPLLSVAEDILSDLHLMGSLIADYEQNVLPDLVAQTEAANLIRANPRKGKKKRPLVIPKVNGVVITQLYCKGRKPGVARDGTTLDKASGEVRPLSLLCFFVTIC